MQNFWKITGSAALICGNLVGVGILALPASIGLMGFFPALVLLLIYGLAMLYTGDVIVRETAARHDENFNFNSLYASYFGKTGSLVATIANIILLYGLFIAYISGATSIVANVLGTSHVFPITLILSVGMCLFVMLRMTILEKYNVAVVLLLLASFTVMALCCNAINGSRFLTVNLSYFALGIPIIMTSYNYQSVLPSLVIHNEFKTENVRKAMIIGVTAGAILTIAWTFCGMGMLSRHGGNSLILAYIEGQPVSNPIGNILHSPTFLLSCLVFSMLAIFSSFIANGLGLVGFVKDFLHNRLKTDGKLPVYLVAFIPPVLVVLTYPKIFVSALNFIGGLAVSTLVGILPCLVVFKNHAYSPRYRILAKIFLFPFSLAFIIYVLTLLQVKHITAHPQNECKILHPGIEYTIAKDILPDDDPFDHEWWLKLENSFYMGIHNSLPKHPKPFLPSKKAPLQQDR